MRDYLTLRKQNDTTGWWWYNCHWILILNYLTYYLTVEDIHDAVYTNCLENIYICMQTYCSYVSFQWIIAYEIYHFLCKT